MNQTNLQIVQQLFQCFADKNIAGLMAILSPDIVWVEPGDHAVIPQSGTYTGFAGVQQLLGTMASTVVLNGFAAKSFCVNDADGTVAAFGSDQGQVIATKKSYTTDWVYLFTLAGGKVTHLQVYMDTLGMSRAFQP